MRDLSRSGARINSRIGKAIHDYSLIDDGDRIVVAVSGGKDSLTLIKFLSQIKSWAPVDFELFAVHIRADQSCGGSVDTDGLIRIFDELGVAHRLADIEVTDEDGKTTCFWCSWNRRKALFKLAEELGCNKVALGHHKDDIVETMLMNLIYNGEVSAMNPRQEMFGGKITIIRPLCYVEEGMIRKYAREIGIPEQKSECPFGKDSKRQYIKDFIREAGKGCPKMDIKSNIFRSISRIREEYLDIKGEAGERVTRSQ